MYAGVRVRVCILRDERGQRPVPPGEEEDHQWRGPAVRHVGPGLRQLRGAP
ncbi:MAG: hypothetical protein AAF984_02955 [Verrucomicrobiota bacterium]